MGSRLPKIGEVIRYINLGDKDGKYPPEIQAAIVTGVYRIAELGGAPTPGNNDPDTMGLSSANKVGDSSDSHFADLKVLYRQGEFNMTCVPFSAEPKRGHWSYI